ncbi:hypothetical protein CC80DRAFT_595068 [Byssothecium circinans]|uniref:Uncharacterized protein n=1 Tax=Byssothecium circinans TaxID=147558 RepID=A0A6A5TQX8_9PLEO|nr:hypothetical protein CC80DRAFT_595068 [Byssothecium circinans]
MTTNDLARDCEQAYRELCASKAKAHEVLSTWRSSITPVDDRIRELKAQQDELTAKKAAMVAEEAAAMFKPCSQFQTAVDAYSKAWNLRFADAMQTKLPAELREMVYNFLWEGSKDAAGKNDEAAALWYATHPGLSVYEDRHVLPHWIDTAHVGPATAFEIIQAWYRAGNTPGHRVYGPQNIEKFLCDDVFHIGFHPSTEVRSVVVYCMVDRCRLSRVCKHNRRRSGCQHTASERSYTNQAELQRCFDSLFKIKNKNQLVVRIELTQCYIRIGVMEEVLKSIGHAYRTLREAGAILTVTWSYCGKWGDWERGYSGPKDCDHLYMKMDSYFDLSVEQWRADFRSFLDHSLADHLVDDEDKVFLDELTTCTTSHNDFVHSMWFGDEDEMPPFEKDLLDCYNLAW